MNRDKEMRYMLHLLKCAVTDATPKLPPADTDWDIIYKFATKHRIISTIYYGICKLPQHAIAEIPQFAAYQFVYKQKLVDDANRTYEIQRIADILKEHHIDFILLKGSVLKYLYPDTSMRNMSDIDILYRNGNLKTIDRLFETLGYNVVKRDAKDTTYLNPTTKIAVEMQTRLVDFGFTRWCKYYLNIWDKCSFDNFQYKMTDEDFYVYHILHMAKHFINGGIGLTHMLDLFIINERMTDLNRKYIDKQLDYLDLKDYENTMNMLVNNWFGDNKNCTLSDEHINLLTRYIFSGGAFGHKKNQEAGKALKNDRKKVSFIRKIFPDKTTMINYYGEFLSKHIYLLPVFWIRLNFYRLIHFNKDTKAVLKQMNSIDESYLKKVEKVLDICGLKD